MFCYTVQDALSRYATHTHTHTARLIPPTIRHQMNRICFSDEDGDDVIGILKQYFRLINYRVTIHTSTAKTNVKTFISFSNFHFSSWTWCAQPYNTRLQSTNFSKPITMDSKSKWHVIITAIIRLSLNHIRHSSCEVVSVRFSCSVCCCWCRYLRVKHGIILLSNGKWVWITRLNRPKENWVSWRQ